MMSIKDLKSTARNTLLGRYPLVIGAMLLSGLISYGISTVAAYAQPGQQNTLFYSLVTLVCGAISFLLTMILSTGSNFLYLNLVRKQPCHLKDIFYSFQHHPDRVIILSILIFLIELVCILPFALLLIFSPWSAGSTGWHGLPVFLAVLGTILFLVVSFAVTLNYIPVFYLYIDDPEKPSLELLRESRRMMKGQRCRFLLLQLSFLGMAVLCILSLGIGFLWVLPYVSSTNAAFYCSLSEKH